MLARTRSRDARGSRGRERTRRPGGVRAPPPAPDPSICGTSIVCRPASVDDNKMAPSTRRDSVTNAALSGISAGLMSKAACAASLDGRSRSSAQSRPRVRVGVATSMTVATRGERETGPHAAAPRESTRVPGQWPPNPRSPTACSRIPMASFGVAAYQIISDAVATTAGEARGLRPQQHCRVQSRSRKAPSWVNSADETGNQFAGRGAAGGERRTLAERSA